MDTALSPLRTPHRFLEVNDLGAAVPYADGMARMRSAMEHVAQDPTPDAASLLLLEHQDTITVTRSGGTEHVRVSKDELIRDGIALVETDRGGDVTFHGAGQLVGYPILRLGPGKGLRVDLLGYLRRLEDAMCSVASTFGVRGVHRKEGMTGVWVASDSTAPDSTWADDDNARKLVAIGVGVGRGVTRHGFALNVTTDLERFTSRITPCGLVGRAVTSLERELSLRHLPMPSMDAVKTAAASAIAQAMGLSVRPATAGATSSIGANSDSLDASHSGPQSSLQAMGGHR